MRHRRWLRAWPAHLGFLALAVVATYGHTLHVPFYLDDYPSIRDNDLVRHWQGFAAINAWAPMRVLVYASFAWNYRLGHFDPVGYHLVNIVIHWLAGIAVHGLTRGLIRTPRVAATAPGAVSWLPPFVAALFLLHPLHTQAVTYIVQRLASAVALLYIGALATYLQARLATAPVARALWGGSSLVFALAALFTKENAATLPLAIVLIEWLFFAHDARSLARVAALGLAGGAAVWVIAGLAFRANPFSAGSMSAVASQSAEISRAAYFATQMPVLWTYIGLFVWPVGLHLDRAAPLRRGLSDGPALLALVAHLAVITLAWTLRRSRPIVSFGILFHYLAHGVESGVIPIPELAFEHRAYLPDVGLCLLAGWMLLIEFPRWTRLRAAVPALAIAVLVVLGLGTWRRNDQWRDPVGFWRDNVQWAPSKARPWGNLGKELLLANRPAEAVPMLEQSLRLRPLASRDDPGRALDVANLAEALNAIGRGNEGLAMIERQLTWPMGSMERSILILDRGNIEFGEGHFASAEASFREALRLAPTSLTARANLASVLAQTGRLAPAESLYQEVLSVDPDDADTRENLARLRRLMSGDASK